MDYTRAQLLRECANATRKYVRLIEEGCDLLGEIRGGLISEDKRKRILANRKEIAMAHIAYTRARKRLWRFLADSDPSWREPEDNDPAPF
jgi:hypothetical protein